MTCLEEYKVKERMEDTKAEGYILKPFEYDDIDKLINEYIKRGDKDKDRNPYPYNFKPPSPLDDFELAPQSQIRTPLKEKGSKNEIYCQYCGMKLTKEEQLTHSCKKKPE